MKKRVKRWGPLLWVVSSVVLLAGWGGTSALAVEPKIFDPELSLTGNCNIELVDPIADPGCPGGTHPSGRLNSPAGITTDSYGNIYVASAGSESSLGVEGRIDIFDAKGNFISEFADPNGPGSLAVDSKGNLYVANRFAESEENVVLYSPAIYKPDEGLIEYKGSPTVLVPKAGSGILGLAIDPATDHLFIKFTTGITEYKSAAEGHVSVEKWGEFSADAMGIAVDSTRGRIYTSARQVGAAIIKVVELKSPHALLFTIDGSTVPKETFLSTLLSLAVDEDTGHLFVSDDAERKVYEFDPAGDYVEAIEHNFNSTSGAGITVDNGKNSPNGALNPRGRYLFVPSGTTLGHSYAFGSPKEGPPDVKSISFANVGDTEAELRASIEPFGLETNYTFQYLPQQQFEEEGEAFIDVPAVGKGNIPAANSPVDVATTAEKLEPETRYRFRVFAENAEGADEEEGEFATFPPDAPFAPCATDPLRIGFSALLPDCRAYELVTPPDTNARAPRGTGSTKGTHFAAPQVSPNGDRISFEIEGGSIPGLEGTGSLFGDPYQVGRSEAGWSTSYSGPSGNEAATILPGSPSPEQRYLFWTTGAKGSAVIDGRETSYMRYPDGHSALVGRGSINIDAHATGKLISENGSHIVFVSPNFIDGSFSHPAIQLEPNAPPNGTEAIYDRTADEVTHVVSLLPSDETPAANEDASYEGASLDGKGVAFSIDSKLYLRYNNEETYELGEGLTFAGIAEGGSRAFYLEGGKLWRFDALTEERTEFSSVSVTPVNVSADGTTAYFVSQSVLTSEPNPNGTVAKGGEENLYRSEEGAISFVGTVTEEDVAGKMTGIGLGLWVLHVVTYGEIAEDPSHTTPTGDILLFESRANLDGYDPEGHVEVYRYDFAANELHCLSCNPTLAPAVDDASLQSRAQELGSPEPLGDFALVTNLSSDGRRAFFQSSEALVPSDVDGLQDVYEWEAHGTGSCGMPAGCIYLITSGESTRIDYLYGVSTSGDDVFVRSSDILLPSDSEETASIYDARVNGGLSETSEEPCNEAAECHPGTAPPSVPSPQTSVLGPPDNHGNSCPKGKHKLKRNGKLRCVKEHRKHRKHHHRKAGTNKKGGHK